MAREVREFIVHREPKGKKRTHSRAVKGADGKYHARTFNDSENPTYEGIVRSEYHDKYPNAKPYVGAVRMEITAFFEIPKSWSKKKREDAAKFLIEPTKKPDCDNIAKMICDALNGFAYRDDAQISYLKVQKAFTDGLPFVSMIMWGDTED